MDGEVRRVELNVISDCEIAKIASISQPMKILDIRFHKDGDIVKHIVYTPVRVVKNSGILSFPYEKVNIIKVNNRYCLIEIWKRPCTTCSILAKEDIYLLQAILKKESMVSYTFICEQHSVERIRNALQSCGIEFYIDVYENRRSKDALTDVQKHVLKIALEIGYLDYPRKVSLKDLAKILGLSPSTVDEILRRAIRNLVMSYFRNVDSVEP